MAAAVVLFIVTEGISFYLHKGADRDTEKKMAKVPVAEIVPGGQKAILTLSNGARPDKLPVRLLYPTSELSSNPENIRARGIIDQFTSRIFWDIN